MRCHGYEQRNASMTKNSSFRPAEEHGARRINGLEGRLDAMNDCGHYTGL